MEKIYKEVPDNFYTFKEYITQDKEVYINQMLNAESIYFYDTCSLQCQSNSKNRDKIIMYIKSQNGIIVITKTVLMELAGNGGNVQNSVIEYLHEFYDANINIVLFNEEDLLYYLRYCLNITTYECNKLLANAIAEVASYKGTVYDIKVENPNNIYKKLHNSKASTDYLYDELFKFARSYKSSGDNLGEELMFLCFIILSRIPLLGKLIFLSNDMNSRASIININEYTKKYNDKCEPYQLTTATLIYKLKQVGLITEKDKLIEMFQTTFTGNVPIYYTDKFAINMKDNKIPINMLVNQIFEDEEFRIYY